ncbi:MAG: 3-deoxy-D-manno-octulosonate 8-phosphate phosphatase (KDO 8-P phosphatase) [Lentimonas sp.]|jgi:3-deoxy-D-manno-octulosonate 8-phosphate phosphatase (KDO 8-P phosphatase)
MRLENNLKGLCDQHGMDYHGFLKDLEVDDPSELTLYDIEAIAEEYGQDIEALLFKPVYQPQIFKDKISKIKLLILDVDGVMTDGGMYVSENGDEMKKFNTKDGMSILHLTKNNFQIAIISSGFKKEAITKRAELLGIQFCHVVRRPKLEVLAEICEELKIELKNVAIIGDDINDLPVILKVGFSACPADAVNVVKANVDVVLTKNGGQGCVRELIDNYILSAPIE